NNNASLLLTNVTVSGNVATAAGGFVTAGGIANYSFNNVGGSTVQIVNSTFSGNTTADPSSADDVASAITVGTDPATVTLLNTILAGGSASPNAVASNGGTITSLGNNVNTDASGGLNASSGDQ